ncbi:MAG TPA: hypothetical protein VLC91_06010 [Spongiibacteraceae bacterium]|nr:hypothetical protein [Spongiibacteraceae bacterium]
MEALEARVISVRETLRATRQDAKVVRQQLTELEQSPGLDYSEQIDAQIDATRNFHLSLDPDRDIVLDIAPDGTLERQAVSLRHAFLVAEKEAWLAADGEGVDWDVLQGKLGQIIQFYYQNRAAPAEPAEELDVWAEASTASTSSEELTQLQEALANQARHIENLEKFKKLFFDTEQKWRDASARAEQYHQQLLARSKEIGGGDDFEALLAQYSSAYSNFGAELADDRGQARAATHVIEIDAERPSLGRTVIANQEEVLRLRNMAIDQHKMILSLRQQLESAQSIEEKDAAIAALHKQLERHERFLKESDICAKQVEAELERTLARNHELEQRLLVAEQDAGGNVKEMQAELARTLVENEALEQQLVELKQLSGGAGASDDEMEQLKKIIEDFTHQSCEMLGAIEQLEQEARVLREQVAGSGAGVAPAEMTVLQQQLAETERELLSLQTQHVELEERYLELKIQQP